MAASETESTASSRRFAICSSSSVATSVSTRSSVAFSDTGIFCTESDDTSPVTSLINVRTSRGVCCSSSLPTKACSEFIRPMALFNSSSMGRLLMRLKTPSTVAAASDVSFLVVGITGKFSPAATRRPLGASSTTTSSTFRPPVNRLAEASRARRPLTTRSCKNASALSADTSPGRPSRAGWMASVTFNRTRLSPNWS